MFYRPIIDPKGSNEVEAPRFRDNRRMKVVMSHWPPLPRFLVLIPVKGWVDTWPEGLCQRKFAITPSEIETATFWIVA